MTHLYLIGIGTGNPDHLTRAAIRTMQQVDLILIPRKGASKADLADLRREIVAEFAPHTQVAEFDLPTRDPAIPDYLTRVEDWHDQIASVWAPIMVGAAKVALLVWGDPSLYDSTLRIAGRLTPKPQITLVPGITSIQVMTAAHGIPLNDLGAPFVVTTGRHLRETGFPLGVDTAIVMLDADCSFQILPLSDFTIYWTAYAGMAQEISLSGPLAKMSDQIVTTRAKARADHGWIMDIYLLRRGVALA